MNTAYQIKPWTQVVTPHADILEGKLDNATYAASLSSVVRNSPNCPKVYRDARDFFNATYLTAELRKLLESVVKGLCGEAGDRVLQLRTPFGGGKTHALLCLYHLVQHRSQLQGIPQLDTLPNPGEVNVITLIGLDIDITGIPIENGPTVLTPWGYLAWKIGGYEAYALVETEDKQRIAPGNDKLRQIFADKTVLLLMDEVIVYVEGAMALTVGESNFGRQILTFIQKLTEVVRELPRAVLVYSLQASVQEAFGNEGVLNTLDKLVSRIDAKKEPVTGDEVMRVIQRRLFADVGDPAIIKEVARQQAELYRKFRESYAETNREKQQIQQQVEILAERIEISYPFHPDLLDLMYHRWGSLPSYQRTRGALQFLASTVYGLREANDTSWLITPANIPFHNEATRSAFFTQVGEREAYSSVLNADLIGRKAKVKIVDNRIGQDSPALALLKVGSRLTSAILMYSFGARGGEDRGILEQDVIAACLAPGLERTTITATLSDLREQLLYLHYVGKRYRFETKANLNKLVADEESNISGEEVLERIRTDLSKALQNPRGKVVLWPKDSAAIPDNISQFSVVYLDPSWAEKSQELILADALTWLENRGNDKRDYKNALAFVIPKVVQMEKARKGARTALAISSLLEQKKKYKFTAGDTEELTSKGQESANEISAAIRRLYEDILLPVPDTTSNAPLRLEMIDLQSQLNTSQNLQDRVLDALKNYVFDSITPTKLVRLSGLESSETEFIKGEELVGYFFRFPNFPKLLGVDPIKKAILEAIANGVLGYVPRLTINADRPPNVENPALISFAKGIPADELDLSGYLLSPSLVMKLRAIVPPDENQQILVSDSENDSNTSSGDVWGEVSRTTKAAGEDKKTVEYKSETSSIKRSVLVDIVDGKQQAHYYTLSAITNKSQIFELFQILPALSDKADNMSVTIEIKAHAVKGFDQNWLRNAIEEPIDEMDIKASTRLE
ncbi:DUF499 domain-containing protein [Microcoleus sp. D3_18a_C4]|uniref:DUF499 domain-containing protein n=1 Tax=Microcoleus sp. D3_18a_C4 TaxID=3055332 RepID=UPI002FD23D0E